MTAAVLLTSDRPGPTNVYLIRRLYESRCVDAVVVVRPAGLRWKLRQLWRIGRRGGLRAILRRMEARRLRARLLDADQERLLAAELCGEAGNRLPPAPPGIRVFKAASLSSRRTLRLFRDLAPELAIQAGAGWVRRPLLDVPRLGFLSLHHGMMPAIRGMDSILWAYVENRPEWIGITVQLIDEGLDTGRIVSQRRVPPESAEHPYSVMVRATRIGAELMIDAIAALRSGAAFPTSSAGAGGAYRSSLTPEAVRALHDIIRSGCDRPSDSTHDLGQSFNRRNDGFVPGRHWPHPSRDRPGANIAPAADRTPP